MKSDLSLLPLSDLSVPKTLVGLVELAGNLAWTWIPEQQALFERVNPEAWQARQGAVRCLKSSRDLEALAVDAEFVAEVEQVTAAHRQYLRSGSSAWFPNHANDVSRLAEGPVAYFCAEYALFEGFNQYAGGLGILAGDHCKEASDLGLPFVAVGLFYRRGFFHQMVDWSGRQEHLYRVFDPGECSARRVCEPGTQTPLVVSIPMEGRVVEAAVWVMLVGRTPLILLDTDLPSNRETDRVITSQLYCNSRSMRLHQETVLGVGGVKALRALGIQPRVFHLNEGHSALLLVERLRELTAAGVSIAHAKNQLRKDSIITIHTPVPEGNERFDIALARTLIGPLVKGSALSLTDLLKLGLGADGDKKTFDMTAFALRLTLMANGVSLLHGRTADATWHSTTKKTVIGVTNGAHVPTWIGPEMKALFESVKLDLGEGLSLSVDTSENRPVWAGALDLDSAALWEAHMSQKRALLKLIARRLREQHARHGEGPEQLEEIETWMHEDGLLIGFARRFAPYKRASLVLTNRKRAAKMLRDEQRIQIVFSGKSHPADRVGQGLVEKVYQETQSADFRGRVLYVEDYDMEVGRALTQGTDVWLNNPRRPLEASGTSGMKAAMNGIPNASILDGWWDEACVTEPGIRNGFAIGDRGEAKSVEAQDRRDAANLYKCLEEEVIPLFLERGADGLPHGWIQVMKQAIASSVYSFSTARMLRDYWNEMYGEAAR